MAGEFHLSSFAVERVATDGGPQDPSPLAGLTGQFISNIEAGVAVPDDGGLFYIPPRGFIIGDDGLFYERLPDGSTSDTPGLNLTANDPDFELSDPLQWKYTPDNFAIGGKLIALASFWFDAPEPGWIGSLDELAPVPGVEQGGGTRGRRGYTPWYELVDDGPPPLYQAYDPEGPVGDPIPLTPTSGNVRPATGEVAVDPASIANAFGVDDEIYAAGGAYTVSKFGVEVPAGKALTVTHGSTIKLDDGQLDTYTAAGNTSLVSLDTGASFTGAVDGNRANQSKTAFNGAGGNSGGIFHNAIVAFGEDDAPLSHIDVDAEVTGAAGYPLNFSYVNDSHIRIRAIDCGGPVVLSNCHGVTVDIEVEDADNEGWKIYPHAVDFINCSDIRGRVVIRNQKGTGTVGGGTALSDWVSGVTIIDSDGMELEIDAEFTELTAQTKSLGVSLVSAVNSALRIRCRGYSDGLLELGGVIDSSLFLDLDGKYAAATGAAGYGINMYNNSQRGDFKGRTHEMCRGVRFYGHPVRRCRGVAIVLQTAVDCEWHGVGGNASKTGLLAKAADQDITEGPAASTIPPLRGHRFFGSDFNFNERTGIDIYDMVDSGFYGCRALNNGQSVAFGGTRAGLGVDSSSGGVVTRTGSNKTGLVVDVQADDSQGTSVAEFPDPTTPTRIAVSRPEIYGVGQTLTVVGAGPAGADLLVRVDDIIHDELVLDRALSTFPTANPTGTISTNGTAVTGSGTTFNADLVGRAYIKVGADYRRIAKVLSNTSAVLDSAFPANVAGGTTLTIVRATVNAAHSQQFGHVFTFDTIAPLVTNRPVPTGNVTNNVVDQTVAASKLRYSPRTNAIVDMNGATAIAVNGQANAVNYAEVKNGANGSSVVFSAKAGDTDTSVGFRVRSFGPNGTVSLRDDGDRIMLLATPAANSENYVNVSPAAAGSYPGFIAGGTDTDIGLTFSPHNAGALLIYMEAGQTTATLRASGVEPVVNLDLATKNGAGVVKADGIPIMRKVAPISLTTTATLAAAGNCEYIYLLGSGAVPTLPTAASNTNIYHVKNVHTAPIALATTSSQTIDGNVGLTILPNESYQLVSDGANWVVL